MKFVRFWGETCDFAKIAALKDEIGRTSEALREKELVIKTMGAITPLEEGVTVDEEPSLENTGTADGRPSIADSRQSVGSQVIFWFA